MHQPKQKRRVLGTRGVQAFFFKRLKTRRLYLKAGKWENLATKEKAFILAESLKQNKATQYSMRQKGLIIALIARQPVKFAMGLGKNNTSFFFMGLGTSVNLLFRKLGPDSAKFVKRIFYKDRFALGVDAFQLGKGISNNFESFASGMGRTGLLSFDAALRKSGKIDNFLSGLRRTAEVYSKAIEKE